MNRLGSQMINEINAGAAKLAPLAAISGVTFLGVGVGDWMYVSAIVYALLQSSYLVWKWVREARGVAR